MVLGNLTNICISLCSSETCIRKWTKSVTLGPFSEYFETPQPSIIGASLYSTCLPTSLSCLPPTDSAFPSAWGPHSFSGPALRTAFLNIHMVPTHIASRLLLKYSFSRDSLSICRVARGASHPSPPFPHLINLSNLFSISLFLQTCAYHCLMCVSYFLAFLIHQIKI